MTKRVVGTSRPHWSKFEPEDAFALKALESGTASDIQQKRVFEYLMKVTKVREDTFVAGQVDTSAYLMGMRAVGLQIVAALNWKPQQENDIG